MTTMPTTSGSSNPLAWWPSPVAFLAAWVIIALRYPDYAAK